MKKMIEREREKRAIAIEKGEVLQVLLNYIIKYHFGRLRLKDLLRGLGILISLNIFR